MRLKFLRRKLFITFYKIIVDKIFPILDNFHTSYQHSYQELNNVVYNF